MFECYLKNKVLLEKQLKLDLIQHYYYLLLGYFEEYQKYIPCKQYRTYVVDHRIILDDYCIEVIEQDNQIVIQVTNNNKTIIFCNAEVAFLHIVGKAI